MQVAYTKLTNDQLVYCVEEQKEEGMQLYRNPSVMKEAYARIVSIHQYFTCNYNMMMVLISIMGKQPGDSHTYTNTTPAALWGGYKYANHKN